MGIGDSDHRRLFLAGATGAIGWPLLELALELGYAVAGMTRTAAKADDLAERGAEPVVCDVFDREATMAAVTAFAPDVVVHQLTDLPDERELLPEFFAANSRVRREGTRNLVDAARAAGARRLLAQSVAWSLPGEGGIAVTEHETMVLEFGGVVVRYGQFYGPRTYHEHDRPDPPRVHVHDAARRTLDLVDAPSGIVVITDDD